MAQAIERPDPKVMLRTAPLPSVGGMGIRDLLYHPLVQSALHILKELVASGGTRLVAQAQETPVPDAEQNLYQALTSVQGYDLAIRHLAVALLTGVSAVEIVWTEDYKVRELRPIPPERVQLGIDEYGQLVSLQILTLAGVQELPLPNAICLIASPVPFLFGVQELPLHALRKYLQAYDRVMKSLDLYLQRHGVPTALAKTPTTYTEAEVQQVYDMLVRMQDALVAVLPGTETQVEFLEPRGAGMQLALDFMAFIERLVVRTLLGSVLAIYEAQYGTRAQAQVHWEVTQHLVNALQQPIETALHAQLWMPLCRYQLGRDPISRLELNEVERVATGDLLRNLGDLVALGMVDPERDRDWIRALIGLGAG